MVEWTQIDPTTGIAVMLVLTGCLLVLFQDALGIDEIPEWFVAAFSLAVGFYLASKTVAMRDEAKAKAEASTPALEAGAVRFLGGKWWSWDGQDWVEIPK